MNNILVTGSNRGIGYAIFRHFLKNNIGKEFYFGCRNLEKGRTAINKLKKENLDSTQNLNLLNIDLEEEKSFLNLSELKNQKIDLLINNAAINDFKDNDINKAKQVLKINYENTKNFIEEMKNKDQLNNNAIILNISTYYAKANALKNKEIKKQTKNISNLKEIENIKNEFLNNFPESLNWYPQKWPCKTYSMSKMLLNYYTKLLSKDSYILDKNIQVYTVHPGWVKTDMGGPSAPESVEYGVESILAPTLFEKKIGDLQGKVLFFGKKHFDL